MQTSKKLGIWMDHASARLTEFSPADMETTVIQSDFSHQKKVDGLKRSEHSMHQGEQHKQAGYYKQLGEAIQNYESVLLFGPTDAKSELLNLLRKDHHFDDIKIEVQSAMEMPIKQEHAFVRDHFSQM